MTESILLQNLSVEQLSILMEKVYKSQLEDLKNILTAYNPDELFTRDQACDYLQIDSSTLWHWTNKGRVTAYGIGNRRYYKKAELLEALKPLKK